MPRFKRGAGAGDKAQVVREWVTAHWRALLSELVSTSLLLGLGCASCLPMPNESREPAPLVNPALAFGFIVTALSVAFGVPSGCHMNPAVSLAAVLMNRMSPVLALGFCVMQVLGATLGYTLLATMAPSAQEAPMGMTLPGEEISVLGATMLEVAMTSLLVMTICALWTAPPDNTGGIKVGMLVCSLTLCGGWSSGTSLNPARSIGPVIYHNHWTDHWIYWVGPLAGSALAVCLHVLLHRGTAPCRRPAAPPPSPPSLQGPAPPTPGGDEDDELTRDNRVPSLHERLFSMQLDKKQPSNKHDTQPAPTPIPPSSRDNQTTSSPPHVNQPTVRDNP